MGNCTGFSDAVAKTQVTSTYNNLNQLTSTNSFSTSSGQAVASGSNAFGYDGDGNMSLVSAKDAGGNLTSQTSYTYDDASRLIGITSPNSSKWQFVYDGMSRLRISRSWVWTNGAWVQNSEVHRVYRGMDVVQERDGNNLVTASYTRTGNIGGLLARSTSTGNVFYGYDGSGNVTTLTDGTGAVVGSYTYDAWGNTIISSGTRAAENPYRFSSKEQLAGFYSYGYRFYSPGIGRWINRDPIREADGPNVYHFVRDNPVGNLDSYGLLTRCQTGTIMCVAVAIGVGGLTENFIFGLGAFGVCMALSTPVFCGPVAPPPPPPPPMPPAAGPPPAGQSLF